MTDPGEPVYNSHAVKRDFHTFLGIDLGGARGKTTAVALLELGARHGAGTGAPGAEGPEVLVREVSMRAQGPGGPEPWYDDTLFAYIERLGPGTAIAINAPLTVPACVRCELAACPGADACTVPAVVWLRERGQDLLAEAVESDRDRVVAIPGGIGSSARSSGPSRSGPRIEPYTHRACEVVMHYEHGTLRRGALGASTGPIAARAAHVRRRLAQLGFALHEQLLEVRPRATVHALFGPRYARGYRRDADPWRMRAGIIAGLDDLGFSPASRMAREEVLGNDHCFDALISGYTAYLWARDGWALPAPVFREDGWIWAPEARDDSRS